MAAMKRNKDDLSSAKKETECGLSFTSRSVQWKEGDRVVAFNSRKVPPNLDWDLNF